MSFLYCHNATFYLLLDLRIIFRKLIPMQNKILRYGEIKTPIIKLILKNAFSDFNTN